MGAIGTATTLISTSTTIADIGVRTTAMATFTEVFGAPTQGGGRRRGLVLGPVPGRAIELEERVALGKAMGPATAPGSGITPHEPGRPVEQLVER